MNTALHKYLCIKNITGIKKQQKFYPSIFGNFSKSFFPLYYNGRENVPYIGVPYINVPYIQPLLYISFFDQFLSIIFC